MHTAVASTDRLVAKAEAPMLRACVVLSESL